MNLPPSYQHSDNSKQARIRHATFGFWPRVHTETNRPKSTRTRALPPWEQRSQRRPWGCPSSDRARPFRPPRSDAASQVFAIPELVEIIVTQDPETMLAGLYINRLTRYLAACKLYTPRVQQSLRELVFEVCATEQLPALRQILSPLVNLGPHPPSRHNNYTTEDDYSTMDPELRTLATKGPNCKMLIHPSSLFFQIFGFMTQAREIQKDVIEHAHLARAAGLMITGIPHMYPGPTYEQDDDVIFSLACQDTRTEGAAARMLLHDQVGMQAAAERLGHSPFEDAMRHNLWRLLDGSRFLNIAIILSLAKGYTLRPTDVDVVRKHNRTDVMDGLLKWALHCERPRELEMILKKGTAAEWATVAGIREQRDGEKITPPPPPRPPVLPRVVAPRPDVDSYLASDTRESVVESPLSRWRMRAAFRWVPHLLHSGAA